LLARARKRTHARATCTAGLGSTSHSPDIPDRTIARSLGIRIVLGDYILRGRGVVILARDRVDERLSLCPVENYRRRRNANAERPIDSALRRMRLTLNDPPVEMINPDDPVTAPRVHVLATGTLDRTEMTSDQGRQYVMSTVRHDRAVERVSFVPGFTVISAPAITRVSMTATTTTATLISHVG